ncbi:hypothetical protein FQV27_03065 [Paracoccus aurantiacus]|uniref:Uncharacterized protein n=1 Tax=Paracoccus aurantiacus TaxID=2599412 RepID=A0A5C6S8J6_9RHOB|nr:DUF6497 family protein [Paracoccus aurantiacus]TXB70847.1 hypothetical protein FQV27_03065 [Paracoccus aurantiacus]
MTVLNATARIIFPFIATAALAEDVTQIPLPVPSGQPIYWQETIHGVPGAHGLTYRFRFVAPDLADLVPMAEPAPMDNLTEEDMAALSDLASSEGAGGAAILSGAVDDGLISAQELDLAPVISFQNAEEAADAYIVAEDDGVALPPAPDILFRDPMHDDIVWLCEEYVLPRIASPAPRPTEIVISLSDRATASGDLESGAVQLFEAFSLPPDRDECVWEPF